MTNKQPLSDVYALLINREVKIARYWPSLLDLCIFIDRDKVEVNKKAKKNEANIQLY